MQSVSLRNAIVVRLLGLLLVGCASADAEEPWDELQAEGDEESESPTDPVAAEFGELELGLAKASARAEVPRATPTPEREQAKGTILPCEFWPDGSYTCCYIIKGVPICTTYDPILALR